MNEVEAAVSSMDAAEAKGTETVQYKNLLPFSAKNWWPLFPIQKIMQLKSWKALKQQNYELEYDDGFPSDTDSDA